MAVDDDEARAAVEKNGRSRWWRRVGTPRSGFRFVTREGEPVKDKEHLERVRSLAIPPAWRHVRVSPSHGSRQQAVGVDAAGRVQYVYHPTFEARRQRQKFEKVERFGKQLPVLRRATNADLEGDGLSRERVLAVVVRLINDLYFRVGSERHAKRTRTFGVTTLRNHHLEVEPDGHLEFSYRGKSGVWHRHVLVDEELADIVSEIKALKGPRLFQYVDEEGVVRPVRSGDVNAYIKAATEDEFSAKDFRTWGGTLLTAVRLAELGPPETKTAAKKNVALAIREVAEHLGNTPAVCRSAYVHPVVLECYEAGVTLDEFRPRSARRAIRGHQPEYEPEERALLKFFEHSRTGNGRGSPGKGSGNGRGSASA